MDIATLRKYVRINRRRLAPTAEDCTQEGLMTEFTDNLAKIKAMEPIAHEFASENSNDQEKLYKNEEVSFSSWILSCISYFVIELVPVYSLMVKDSVPLQRILSEKLISRASDSIGAAGFLLYILPMACLVVSVVRQMNRNVRGKILAGSFLRGGLILACAYYGGFRNITLFGNTGNWFYVMLFGGLLITFIFRMAENVRIRKNRKRYKEISKRLEQTEVLIDRTVKLLERMGDKREAELRALCPNIVPSARIPWFNMCRSYDRRWGTFDIPKGRTTETDFITPFSTESTSAETTVEHKSWDFDSTLYYTDHQELGYTDISAGEAWDLLKKGKIAPFYNWEIPKFIEGLHYSLLRHRWKFDVNTYHKSNWIHEEEVDSFEHLLFDLARDSEEMEIFGESAESYAARCGDAWIQEEVAKYERRKAEARKKIKPDIERSLKTSQNGYSRHYEGDEIGTLLVRTPDGELVGVYCGDTEQSVKYTYDMLHDEVGFRLTPTMPGRTAAQKALLYRCYIR